VAELEIVALGRAALVEVVNRDQVARVRTATLCVGSPEGDRGDWMVEKLAELGVAVFQPVDTERARWPVTGTRRERWRRLALAALRQSHRVHLLEIRDPLPLGEALAAMPEDCICIVADAAGRPAAEVADRATGETFGVIGPSSGLSDPERSSLAASGFTSICLSDSRLRTETAALAWAAWWAARVFSRAS
jgi:16S rRNA (uracil1498-N3)-methyltransferase